VVTTWDLSLLNVECRFPIEKVVEALRARGHGALCFHGPPGTGKTALAEHIARALGRPLLIRQASDIASKFVGETEQNMARMFAQAEQEQAVLLLDEADSFLRSRRMAERNYEVSEVNEMLQGMERFAGVFICTTNLFDELDEAALRRFTFKIRFLPLRAEQRERMFVAEALGGAAERLSDEQRRRLALLDQLGALQVTPQQALGGVGALLGLAQSQLAADQYAQLTGSVPGLELLGGPAGQAAEASDGAGGVLGRLGALGGLLGASPAPAAPPPAPLDSRTGVDQAFALLGMDSSLVGPFGQILLQFLAGQGLAGTLLQSLGGIWGVPATPMVGTPVASGSGI